MKIFLVTDRFVPERTTVGKIVFDLAKQLVSCGHEVGVLTTTRNRDEEGVAVLEGIQVFKIYADYHERWQAYLGLYNPQTTAKVQSILSKHRPEVVHFHNLHRYFSYHCLKLAKASGAKVFLTAHDVMLFHFGKLFNFIDPRCLSCPGTFNYKVSPWQQFKKFGKRYNPFRNMIIRYYLQFVDKIFAVSTALEEALSQNGIRNLGVIHNAISVEGWRVSQSAQNDFIAKRNLHGKKIVLFVGRLSGAKGGRQAILAMKKVAERLPEAVLLVIGDKNFYAQEMLEIARREGIEGRVHFSGWLSGDDLKCAYHISNLVIMPSICFDTFGMVCLEAMVCSKPVVATCFGGPREIISDGRSGYVINPFNIDVLAEKIIDLLSDQAKAVRFGEFGHQRVIKEFELSVAASKLLAGYASV